jgi:Zn-dependent protease with chaperone function
MTNFPPDIERMVDQVYPPARQMLADQLAAITHPLYFVFVAFEFAFLLWFYFSGAAAGLRTLLARRIKNPLLTAAAFIAITFVGLSIVMLPLSFYGSYVIEHEFNLSAETVSRWFRDWGVALTVSAVVLAVVGALLLRAIARWRAWPLVAALGAAVLLIFGSAIFPLFIAPLFNKYTPLPPSPLTRSILQLAAAQGIKASVVYEFNMSVQTREVNAFVSGLGGTERIAVGDTLLAGMPPDEVLYVMAHEMGHYKLGHLWLGTFETWVFVLAAIALIATVGARIAVQDQRRSHNLADPAAVPLIAALLLLFQIVAMPAANALSRDIEHAADVFAAEHTHLGDAGIKAQARIASIDLSPLHPSPLTVWFFYTHPPPDQRIMDAARLAHLQQGERLTPH